MISSEIKKYNLEKEYNWFKTHNQGDKNPYHNNYHIERVTLFTIKGCEYYKIEYPYIRLAATAAIFHDFNHSGGKFKNDDDNIQQAIYGFLEFNKETGQFSEEEIRIIIDIIKQTRFPYLTDCNTLLEKIVRDSDVLQGFLDAQYIEKTVKAIATESGIGLKQMAVGQEKFIKGIQFATDWAKDLFYKNKDQIIENTKELQ